MIETSLVERIAIIQRTRQIAALALSDALKQPREGSSERAICDRWIQIMGKTTSICSEGWYQPPPGGAAVLIGYPEDHFARLNYNSLRNPSFWSSNKISLREDSLLYAYASPFDPNTALIGDIGITLYRGAEELIRSHLSTCLEVTARTACFAEVGMEFRELFNYAQRQIDDLNLRNETSSTASGTANIGHTVPWSYQEYSEEAKQCLERGSLLEIRNIISKN